MEQYNFNKNFNDFRENITLTEQNRQTLISARKIIRSTIRQAFNEMPTRYFTNETKILTNFSKNANSEIKPRFMTQGSFAYNTINKPEKPPIQQMDLDYGIYLPLSYVEDKANGSFQQAAKIVRNVIYSCIEDLCLKGKWEIKKHPKCLRITINHTSHIDLPVYSIPDNQTSTIQDSAKFAQMSNFERFLSYDKVEDVLLATDDGWLESDPRKIQEWVKNTKEKYSNNFIYYSRYLKAWKDHQWNDSKFSSIMIMAGIAQALSERGYSKNKNIALDLSIIATSLKLYLSNGGIEHPTESGVMDKNLPNKNEIISKLNILAINLSEAVKTNNVKLLIDCFGDRFPDNADTKNIAPVVITSIKNEAKPWLPS